MKKYRITMMCTSCKWKITEALENKGFKDFLIDMDSSTLTFQKDVNSDYVISVVTSIGYKIEEIENIGEMTDDEYALIKDSMRSGF